MKTILLLLFLCGGAFAQTTNFYAVKWLSMEDAGHEFKQISGCPTNWVTTRDFLGTNSVSPFPGRAVISDAQLQAVYQAIGPTFTNWYQNTYRPYAVLQETTAKQVFTNKLAALAAVMDDLETYRARWQSGQTVTLAQANLVMSNLTETILRLKPVIKDLYRGD